MTPSDSKMLEAMNFQQRWALRRAEFDRDSSSNYSKSSSSGDQGPANNTSVSGQINASEDNDTNILLQNDDNGNPGSSGRTKSGDGDKMKRGKSRKDQSTPRRRKKGCSRKTRTFKTAIAELEGFMDSLIDDLKVARRNLVTWMQEETKNADKETVSEPGKGEGCFPGEKFLYQNPNNCAENSVIPYGNNLQVQQKNQCQENLKVKENVPVRDIINLEENINEGHDQEKLLISTQFPGQNTFRSGNSSKKSSKRTRKSNKPDNPFSCCILPEAQDKPDQALVPVTPIEKQRKRKSVQSSKSNSKTGTFNQNVQVQQPKSIVLGIRAENSKGRSSTKNLKSKRNAASNDHKRIPDQQHQFHYSQVMGSIPSSKKEKEQRPGLPFENNVPYFPLPPSTLVRPNLSNHGTFTTSLFSANQPRTDANQTTMNPERANLLLSSGSYTGLLQGLQQEERSRINLNPGDFSYFNQNSSITSMIGNQAANGGFGGIPSQFGFEHAGLGLNARGGMKIPGGHHQTFTLPEQFKYHGS